MVTVKEHAAACAQAIADGAELREVYSKVVRENDLTLWECDALRMAIDAAVIAKLRELQAMAYTLRIG